MTSLGPGESIDIKVEKSRFSKIRISRIRTRISGFPRIRLKPGKYKEAVDTPNMVVGTLLPEILGSLTIITYWMEEVSSSLLYMWHIKIS